MMSSTTCCRIHAASPRRKASTPRRTRVALGCSPCDNVLPFVEAVTMNDRQDREGCIYSDPRHDQQVCLGLFGVPRTLWGAIIRFTLVRRAFWTCAEPGV